MSLCTDIGLGAMHDWMETLAIKLYAKARQMVKYCHGYTPLDGASPINIDVAGYWNVHTR
jgi:hypothetical protein